MQVIFLIGNKSDLEAQRDVTYEEAKQFADENGIKEAFKSNISYQQINLHGSVKTDFLSNSVFCEELIYES